MEGGSKLAWMASQVTAVPPLSRLLLWATTDSPEDDLDRIANSMLWLCTVQPRVALTTQVSSPVSTTCACNNSVSLS